jgi:glycosyltransferase involved in cell wall biosynthesis
MNAAAQLAQIEGEPQLFARPVFLFDSNGLNPYGFVVADALSSGSIPLKFLRREGVNRPLGKAFGPKRGASGAIVRMAHRTRLLVSVLPVVAEMRNASVAHFLWEGRLDAVLAVVARHVLRKPVVVTVHDPTRAGSLARLIRRVLVWTADCVVMHSEPLATVLLKEQRGMSPDQLIVVPLPSYGVLADGLSLETARRQAGLEASAEVLLFFGRLDPDKGINTFVAASKRLLRERPRLNVIVAGIHPPTEVDEALRDLVRLGGERVQIHVGAAHMEEPQLLSLVGAADLIALPLDRASQSSSSVLALSLGRPLVTTTVGENAALEAADAARIVLPRDPEGLADACTELLDSPAELLALGRRGKAFADAALSPVIMQHAVVEAYSRLTDGERKG